MMQASLSLQLKVKQILLLSRLNNKMLSPTSRVASMTEAGWFLSPNLKNLIMVVVILVMEVVMELVMMVLVMMVLVTLLMKTPMTTTPMTTIPLEAMAATTILMEVMSTRTPTTPTLLPLLQPTLPA